MSGHKTPNDSHNYHDENYYDREITELYNWNAHLKPGRKQ